MGSEYKIDTSGKYPVLILNGKIKDSDAELLKIEVQALFDDSETPFGIDVSGVEFIDSFGLGVIVYYHSMMVKQNRILFIINRDPDRQSYMSRLIDLTHLEKVLTIEN